MRRTYTFHLNQLVRGRAHSLHLDQSVICTHTQILCGLTSDGSGTNVHTHTFHLDQPDRMHARNQTDFYLDQAVMGHTHRHTHANRGWG